MLSFVVALYLISIRNKSTDSWRITGLFIFYVLVHAGGFVADSNHDVSWNKNLLWMQDLLIGPSVVYTIWIFYKYHENPFPVKCAW